MENRFLRSFLSILFIVLLGIYVGGTASGWELPWQSGPIQEEVAPRPESGQPENRGESLNQGDSLFGTNTVRDIVAMSQQSVVKIETVVQVSSSANPFLNDPFFREFFGGALPQETQRQTGLGSGFIFSPEGYILTNHHVIDGAEQVFVYLSSREEPYEARILGRAPELDLAVLKIEGEEAFHYLDMGNSEQVQVGDWVVAIGNPYGLDHTVTVGVISATGRPLNIEGTLYQNLFQTDAAINPGNSGGPMLNVRGEVIGINTAVNASAQGIGFAIPTSTVLNVVDDLKAGVDRQRPWMGITMQPLTQDLAAYFGLEIDAGVVINEVVEGAPAQKAGLRRGDVIIRMDGQKIMSSTQVQSIVINHQVGDELSVIVYRDGTEQEIMVRLEANR